MDKIIMNNIDKVIPIIATLLGIVVQAAINHFNNKRLFKQQLLAQIYEKRITAYQTLHKKTVEYKDYFNKFIQTGNEYVEVIDPKEFGPMTITNEIIQVFYDNEIYFSKDTTKEFWNMANNIFSLNSLAIMNCLERSFEVEEMVSNESANAVKLIEKFQDELKKALGLSKLEKIIKL